MANPQNFEKVLCAKFGWTFPTFNLPNTMDTETASLLPINPVDVSALHCVVCITVKTFIDVCFAGEMNPEKDEKQVTISSRNLFGIEKIHT